MPLNYFVKETSEISDQANWAKKLIDNCESLFIDSIEGYTVDYQRGVILLMERAKVHYDEMVNSSIDEITQAIATKDGSPNSLARKLRLAEMLGLNLRYALYSEDADKHHVWVYVVQNDMTLIKEFECASFTQFGQWLDSARSISLEKEYGHKDITDYQTSQFSDLPGLDQTLRNNKTPWLANLDGFISNKQGEPIALVEFNTTNKSSPELHCNSYFFLCDNDSTRVLTWEIARIHSGLPFLVIVWSSKHNGYRIKVIEKVVCPYTDIDEIAKSHSVGPAYWNALKQSFNFDQNIKNQSYNTICTRGHSFSFSRSGSSISLIKHFPPLSLDDKTFPHIYYSENIYSSDNSSFMDRLLITLGVVDSTVCPMCGGKLVERSGPYSKFMGCSKYPKCSYTAKIKPDKHI